MHNMGLMNEHMAAMETASYDRTWIEIDALLEQAAQDVNSADPLAFATVVLHRRLEQVVAGSLDDR